MGKKPSTLEIMGLNQIDYWNQKNVLITGHTGFKGSWLSYLLIKLNANVSGISLQPEKGNNLFNELSLSKELKSHTILDIRDKRGIKSCISKSNFDAVFHLAAQPLVKTSYKEPVETWTTNVIGSLNILEALKLQQKKCAVVMITTDKVYRNKEWDAGYKETDELGGHDPYSASKAAAEIAISSWRDSFCGDKEYQTNNLAIATARAGNVIGGGDWAKDRIVPDLVRSITNKSELIVRNPLSTRPWQHVLDPLWGYLILAKELHESLEQIGKTSEGLKAINFGPTNVATKTVEELLSEIDMHWKVKWSKDAKASIHHEAKKLSLEISKAKDILGWRPLISFEETVEWTIKWYKSFYEGKNAKECCKRDIEEYLKKVYAQKEN